MTSDQEQHRQCLECGKALIAPKRTPRGKPVGRNRIYCSDACSKRARRRPTSDAVARTASRLDPPWCSRVPDRRRPGSSWRRLWRAGRGRGTTPAVAGQGRGRRPDQCQRAARTSAYTVRVSTTCVIDGRRGRADGARPAHRPVARPRRRHVPPGVRGNTRRWSE